MDTPVGHNNVATQVKRQDRAKDYREFLREQHRGLCAEVVCHVELEVKEGICKAKPFSTVRLDYDPQTHQLP
jgi:hypothetical protein